MSRSAMLAIDLKPVKVFKLKYLKFSYFYTLIHCSYPSV